MPPLNGLALEVRRVQMSRLARGESDIELVARDLAMSSRTLQRGLAAYLTGYSEPAAFHRAFRRWTGVTAQGFRQRLRHNLQSGA